MQYRVTTRRKTLRRAFDVDDVRFVGWRRSIEVRPGARGPVVLGGDLFSDRWCMAKMEWGLQERDGGDFCLRVGSNVERWRWIVEDPELRCLVVASEFSFAPGPEEAPSRRFGLADREAFAFAGVWVPPAIGEGSRFAVITCEPNAALAASGCTAMPVVLDRADHAPWLSGALSDTSALLRPHPAVAML